MNWKEGSWNKKTGKEPIGRITLASEWAPLGGYEERILHNPLSIYGDVLPELQNSDLNIVNVECTLGEEGEEIPKGGPNFRFRAQTVQALSAVPFHVACLANSHTMDYGPASLANTINLLQENNIQTVGAGMDGVEAAKPLIVEVKGIQVGIINCGEGEECQSFNNGPGVHPLQVDKIRTQVENLKEQTDLVIVIFHGGREYIPVPPVYVVEQLRAIASMDVDAVIAHHPHVPQGIEIINQVPIVYGQGNFVFYRPNDSFFRHAGYLVHLDINKKELVGLKIQPYLIEEEQLTLMKSSLKKDFLNDLRKVSEILEDEKKIQLMWDAVVDGLGVEGIAKHLSTAAERLSSDPLKGAAWTHNLFNSPAHREVYINGLRRAAAGNFGNSPLWAKELIQYWEEKSLS